VAVAPPGWNQSLNTPLINIPGQLVLNAGIVTLPFPFLCNQSNPIIERLVCRLASIDCTYVHKTYGGKCGTSPNPVPGTTQEYGEVFICNDVKPTSYDFKDVSDPAQCNQLLGSILGETIVYSTKLLQLSIVWKTLVVGIFTSSQFLFSILTDPVLDLALKQVIRTRFMTDLCQGSSPNLSSVGCNSDCRNNHQYASGYCYDEQTPTATFVGELFPDFQCVCSY